MDADNLPQTVRWMLSSSNLRGLRWPKKPFLYSVRSNFLSVFVYRRTRVVYFHFLFNNISGLCRRQGARKKDSLFGFTIIIYSVSKHVLLLVFSMNYSVEMLELVC